MNVAIETIVFYLILGAQGCIARHPEIEDVERVASTLLQPAHYFLDTCRGLLADPILYTHM